MLNGDPVPLIEFAVNDTSKKPKTPAQLTNRWKKVLNPKVNDFPRRTGKWTNEEDKLLTEAVKRATTSESGETINVRISWSKISTSVPGK